MVDKGPRPPNTLPTKNQLGVGTRVPNLSVDWEGPMIPGSLSG